MSVRLMNLIWQKSTQKGSPLLLLLAIADNANDEGIAWPSVRTLAAKTRMSERQVQRMLSELRETGELAYESGTGRGHTHTFQLCVDVLEGRQLDTLESDKPRQVVAHYQTERVTSAAVKGDISGVKGDIAMSPEPSVEPSVEPKEIKTTVTRKKRGGTDPGSRLPENFVLSPKLRKWALREAADVDLDAATLEFCDYWRGVPGSRGKKLDWVATWRNRMREVQSRIAQRKGFNGNGRQQTHTQNPRVDTIRSYDYSVFNREQGEGARDDSSEVQALARVEPTSSGRSHGNGWRVA